MSLFICHYIYVFVFMIDMSSANIAPSFLVRLIIGILFVDIASNISYLCIIRSDTFSRNVIKSTPNQIAFTIFPIDMDSNGSLFGAKSSG